MEPCISIIVPVYNAEKFLEDCLNSILKQTYNNFEVICVDDNSNDRSWEILTRYAKRDKRVHVFHKEKEGVSKARNLALEQIKGNYVLFVDSDDWIEEDTCEIAYKLAIDKNADVIMWPYVRELDAESREKHIFDRDMIFEGSDVKDKLHRRMIGICGEELRHPENADALCTVWGKLYRSEIITKNHLRFVDIREIGTYEDGLFNLDYFYYVNTAVFHNNYLYHYRRVSAETLTSVYNPRLPEQWSKLFSIMESYIEENKLDATYRQALNNRISLSLISLGINVILMNKSANIKIRSIKNIIEQENYKYAIKTLKTVYLPVHWKVFFSCAKLKCSIGVYILLLAIQKIRGR